MDIYKSLIIKIILEQENIIGPLAVEEAKKVNGLKLNWQDKNVILNGDEKNILKQLVNQYEKFFGMASVEVCKEILDEAKISLTS